jgi:hypothetical protein
MGVDSALGKEPKCFASFGAFLDSKDLDFQDLSSANVWIPT